MDFCVEWLNHLLNSLDENCDSCLFYIKTLYKMF